MARRSGWMWLAGALGLAWAGCGGSDDVDVEVAGLEADLVVRVKEGKAPLSCDQRTTCWEIDSDRDVTDLFLEFDPSCADLGDASTFSVSVRNRRNELVRLLAADDFKQAGGPCPSLPRVGWVALNGKQKDLEVCISFARLGDGDLPGGVRLGAKAASECRAAGTAESCLDCD